MNMKELFELSQKRAEENKCSFNVALLNNIFERNSEFDDETKHALMQEMSDLLLDGETDLKSNIEDYHDELLED